MSIISFSDNIYAFRFLWLLTRKWKALDAYKFGIIDEVGKPLKKYSDLTNSKEKGSYTKFHRIVFSIKRLLEKVPFGKSTIASYAAALYLIKEETGMNNDQVDFLISHMKEFVDTDMIIESSNSYHSSINSGIYISDIPIISRLNGNEIDSAGAMIKIISSNSSPVDKIGNVWIYEGIHLKSKQIVPFTLETVRRKVK